MLQGGRLRRVLDVLDARVGEPVEDLGEEQRREEREDARRQLLPEDRQGQAPRFGGGFRGASPASDAGRRASP